MTNTQRADTPTDHSNKPGQATTLPRRLTTEEVLSLAKPLPPFSIEMDDPRLPKLDPLNLSLLWLSQAAPEPGAVRFIEWPDSSLGFAFMQPDEAGYSRDILSAYEIARSRMELLTLDHLSQGGNFQ